MITIKRIKALVGSIIICKITVGAPSPPLKGERGMAKRPINLQTNSRSATPLLFLGEVPEGRRGYKVSKASTKILQAS